MLVHKDRRNFLKFLGSLPLGFACKQKEKAQPKGKMTIVPTVEETIERALSKYRIFYATHTIKCHVTSTEDNVIPIGQIRIWQS